jgi:threonyl-tRNA synthetase
MREIVKRDLPIVREVWDRDEAKKTPSASSARTTRSRSSKTSSPRAKRSRSIARATGSTSAAARICPAPASWARLQADEAGRRLLARRLPQRDAAAHLRHRLARQERNSRPTCTAWKRPRSATIASSASSSTCSISRKRRPGMAFWHHKGRSLLPRGRAYMREQAGREYGYQEVETPQVLDRSCGRSPGTGRSSRRHVHDAPGRSRLRDQADELSRRTSSSSTRA